MQMQMDAGIHRGRSMEDIKFSHQLADFLQSYVQSLEAFVVYKFIPHPHSPDSDIGHRAIVVSFIDLHGRCVSETLLFGVFVFHRYGHQKPIHSMN
jgi:hypothetical protein